ncbi:MAG: metallophosphoesterase [Clostridia bacterium]|nr:metallophosphoesterase [Clostridia bacterium]
MTEHTAADASVPAAFDGFTIVQISDLHDESFGENNETLLRLLSEAKPDLIAITGDIADGNRMALEHALALIPEIVKVAPCYFAAGNHESGIGEDNYRLLEQTMNDAGVTILSDEYIYLSRGDGRIVLAGLQDPYFVSEHRVFGKKGYGVIREKLESLALPRDEYTVLLSHRPEVFELYVEYGVDLALTGHAHGGQIRLPLLGGLIAPHQGLFPKYDAGMYEKDGTQMYVNRGLGNSRLPLRINDRPEIAVIRLTNHTETEDL